MKNQDKLEIKYIFQEIKKGNNKAIEELYQKYYKTIYGVAFSVLKNKDDSDDVVQKVFSKLYEIEKDKMPKDKETTWLYSVTKNEAINLLRRNNNHLDIESIYEIEDKNDEINNIINQDSYNRLISKLNEKEKEIISLKILSNLSFDEISQLLNESSGTIKWRYYKSINTLKILLSNLGMFMITFIIGIKILLNNKEINNADSIVEDVQNTVKDELNQNESVNTEFNTDDIINRNEIYDNREKIRIQDNINYTSIGFISISMVFMIIIIVFSIIFLKHQLKSKKKRLNNRKG